MIRPNRLLAIFALTALLAGCAGAGSSTGLYVDDSVITSKVKARLYKDKTTSGWDIKVATKDGVVQLSGFVKSEEEKAKAGELAKGVKGVKSIANDLIVKP
jgi:osmotically-inducible protein OsmY